MCTSTAWVSPRCRCSNIWILSLASEMSTGWPPCSSTARHGSSSSACSAPSAAARKATVADFSVLPIVTYLACVALPYFPDLTRLGLLPVQPSPNHDLVRFRARHRPARPDPGSSLMRIVALAAAAVSVLAGLVPATMASAAVSGRGPSPLPVTSIAVNGNGGDRVYDGVGAVLGGGGDARYLMDYPAAERTQILDYLFEPGYGASLQLLKLEIGGDANSSDGAEPSVEHTQGKIDCNAGYEFSVAKQAVALNPYLKLYGLQWAAPGWAGDGTNSVFTSDDITYLIDWLNCAKQQDLTISY